jgi:hypothetical protein
MLGAHPSLYYREEQFDLWSAVDPITDILQQYRVGNCRSILDGRHVTSPAQKKFLRLMAPPHGYTLVEKSPINALRVGYVLSLANDARFVHIVRDGMDVVQSIVAKAAITRQLAFRLPINDWWGIAGAKWAALERDGIAAGYYADEVDQLVSDAQRGAYEWLLTMHEVEAWRGRLDQRLIEVRYEDLINDTRTTVNRIAKQLGLSCPAPWLDSFSQQVNETPKCGLERLELPANMCRDFNGFQEKFGFIGRAVPRDSELGPGWLLPDGERCGPAGRSRIN